ncbi:MAG: deoxyribodipyrimidine photo-lyase [Chitinophagaceae bacterium]
MQQPISIFWFRRDLRLQDNAGLYHALKSGHPVVPIFIFDKYILDDIEVKDDRRVEFIHAAVSELQLQLVKMGSSLEVYYGYPLDVFRDLLQKYQVNGVYTNHDYEPYAKQRDEGIFNLLRATGVSFDTYKDQVIFDKKEVMKENGSAYSVFTPYSRQWLAKLNDFYIQSYPTEKYFSQFYRQPALPLPSLTSMGFHLVEMPYPSKDLVEEIIFKYGDNRNFPGSEGTSRLGVHLRFGTVSIRDLARRSRKLSATFLNELIWRDFYQMVLWNFPRIGESKAFKPEYDNIEWRNNEAEFQTWCEGNTGYPMVDAGIHELNETGFMHNRVRMVVASFLTKHLLIDWRWGEAYFAQKLLDFDLASNNGGWQWACGSGCDAAPFFRIFNPTLQAKKFDPEGKYLRKWVPGFEDFSYPAPMVEHDFARKRCLQVFGKAVNALRV